VAHLSGGMQRRVNLAAGTLHGPRLLLLDEPTVGLDPSARDAIHQALRQLRQQGMALLMTTHDLEEAESLADRVALLCDGRLVAAGPVAALVDQAFGGGQEVNLRLGGDLDEARTAELSRAGLAPAGAHRWWVGVLHEEDPDGGLAALRGQVTAAGFTVEEVRVRRPGLHGLFLRLTGRSPGMSP
jgi:ABC-2 type transport system ATP-binding protein